MKSFTVQQTPCLIRGAEGLENEWFFEVSVEEAGKAKLTMDGKTVWQGALEPGSQRVSFRIPEPEGERNAVFALTGYEDVAVRVLKPRHWEVHVVQLSHQDAGYTDIPSETIEESGRWLKNALDDMDRRSDYPPDATYRIVVEQSYALYAFLRQATAEDRARMMGRIRCGDVEVTALWGNLISELLSPEEMLRAMYPSQAIARETGVPIVSAEHNDITGFSWGYCTALTEAGVAFFAPGLPQYYSWGGNELTSFWDVNALFGSDMPGAFWWESPQGKRLLFWSNNWGCGGDFHTDMPTLLPRLMEYERRGWQHTVIRWPVSGANRDNSPFTPGYADFIRDWNARYAYPHLVCSTEKTFYQAFTSALDVELPVYRGGVDGQDYPVASTSQTSSSALNRANHAQMRSAEMLYALASDDEMLFDLRPRLQRAMENMLMADEHAFGFTYPACEGQRASWWEHGCYAARARAYIHDVCAKAMASIADRIEARPGTLRLTVFNTSGQAGMHAVSTLLRQPDNCGTEIRPSNKDGAPRMYELNGRMPVHPQGDLLNGCFRLVDHATGEEIPYRIRQVAWNDPRELAAESAGIGTGTRRFSFFEDPKGAMLDLRFAMELPACGYRTLKLVQTNGPVNVPEEEAKGFVENESYRISFDETGVCSVVDRQSGEELFDTACAYRPGTLLVRNVNEEQPLPMRVKSVKAWKSAVESGVTVRGSADGVYECAMTWTLTAGVDAVAVDARIVKSKKPLQTVFMAFPFRGTGLRYQSAFHETAPAADLLAGSHADAIVPQDYVAVEGSDILWNSANAPVVHMSHLWKGYVSPAHRCVMALGYHAPLKPEQFDTGHIYPLLMSNNFGTNFYASQLSDTVFSFTFAKRHGRSPSAWGADAAARPTAMLTDRCRGTLPARDELLEAGELQVLAYKHAEDGNGMILRLFNPSGSECAAALRIRSKKAALIAQCSAVEEDLRPLCGDAVTLQPGQLMTVRLRD
ncbi:MAG: glycosyl hydrolase-related protein [Christensenellales bacterium]|jgi:hypothetical protein